MSTNQQYLKSKAKKQIFIYEYLRSHPCVDCGETDPIVLEFDHISPKGHRISLCSMSLERLIAEVAKCKVRCANCHKRRHSKRITNGNIETMMRGNISAYDLLREEVFSKKQKRIQKARNAAEARWNKHRVLPTQQHNACIYAPIG